MTRDLGGSFVAARTSGFTAGWTRFPATDGPVPPAQPQGLTAGFEQADGESPDDFLDLGHQ